ncbi:hypothetical protein F2P81_021932 [Scophthalmus maximus]|uniref:Uncharacterized protein n=1 Tax=Scophthalmus maximus TaxID=52904 RepID=A0A6A4S1I6_SCOMX|nr:hypothetical protein F2P81_021932 [Scophthalmus maximus]
MRAALPSIGTCELRQDSELPLCTAQVNNRLISQRCRVKQSVILTPNFPCDAEWGDKLKCLKLTMSGHRTPPDVRLYSGDEPWHVTCPENDPPSSDSACIFPGEREQQTQIPDVHIVHVHPYIPPPAPHSTAQSGSAGAPVSSHYSQLILNSLTMEP